MEFIAIFPMNNGVKQKKPVLISTQKIIYISENGVVCSGVSGLIEWTIDSEEFERIKDTLDNWNMLALKD